MKKIVKKTTLWRSSVCGTDYQNKSVAKECESKPIEQKKFKVGDRVISMEPRVCLSASEERKFKEYKPKGRINKIFGPLLPDEDYWNKRFGGLPDRHVFLYKVTYKCPKCGKEKEAAYFEAELKKIK